MKILLIGLLVCLIFVGCGGDDIGSDCCGEPSPQYPAEILGTLWDPANGTLRISFAGVPNNLEVRHWRVESDDYIPITDFEKNYTGEGYDRQTHITVDCEPEDAEEGIEYLIALSWDCIVLVVRKCDC